MPHESRTAKALRRATEQATVRGHALDGWRFEFGQADAMCMREGCGCRVLVTPGSALELIGAAIMLPCREGGSAELEAPQPAPSGPEALPLAPAELVALERAAVDEAPIEAAPAQTPQPMPAPRPQPTHEQLRALSLKSFGRRTATGVRS